MTWVAEESFPDEDGEQSSVGRGNSDSDLSALSAVSSASQPGIAASDLTRQDVKLMRRLRQVDDQKGSG